MYLINFKLQLKKRLITFKDIIGVAFNRGSVNSDRRHREPSLRPCKSQITKAGTSSIIPLFLLR